MKAELREVLGKAAYETLAMQLVPVLNLLLSEEDVRTLLAQLV